MSRNVLLYLNDILNSSKKAIRYVSGMTFEQFAANEMAFDGVVRNIEIIGEAASKIPTDIQDEHAEIPWRKMMGMRNLIAHAYFGLDDQIIWDVVQQDLPALIPQIQHLIDGHGSSTSGTT